MRRLIARVLGVRCPYCRDRTRFLYSHVWVNHAGEAS